MTTIVTLSPAQGKPTSFRRLAQLPSTWLLIAILAVYACDGIIWTLGSSGSLAQTYGNLATGGSGTADNIALMLFLTVTLIPIAVLNINPILRAALNNPALVVMAVWVTASAAWSQYPIITVEWTPPFLFGILFIFYFTATRSPETQMRLVLLLGTICLVLTVFLATVLGSRDPEGGWRGLYAQKNMCCMNTEFLLVPAFYAARLGKSAIFRIFRVVYIVSSMSVIVLTKSSTGLVVLPLLIAVVFSIKLLSRFRGRDRVPLILIPTSIAAFGAVIGVSTYGDIARLIGKDPTLTGRTEIWAALVASIAKHPFVGYGYKAFWRGYEGESAGVSFASHWAVPSSHNAALEVFVTLGAIGLFIVAWFCVKATRDSFTCLVYSDSPYSRWFATTVILMFLNSVDEAEMLVPFGFVWLAFMLAAVNLSKSAQQLRTSAT